MVKNNFDNMNIVIVGHVDHGKSTVIGRLLADTNSLPEGKLEQVKETCRRNSKPFEYAFLLDALKDEQAQGITIDAARVFFSTPKRKYIIIDAPGHIEFLKNMVTGAARAEAALLVIDANEGVMENSKRHGYLLSMLGIKQVVVLVNKMDLINFEQARYEQIVEEYKAFLAEIGVEANAFIPVSGFMGDNVATVSENMPWYRGETVLQKLDLLENKNDSKNQVFRMPVQGVYKFTAGGDDRRIVAGTIDTGRVKVGDEVIFYPSGKRSKVKSIERFNSPAREEDTAGSATGFSLEEQIYITRGELACVAGEIQPEVTTRIKTKLFWLGIKDLNKDRRYHIKLGTQKVTAELEEVITVLDASTLSTTTRQYVQRHEVAEVVFRLGKEAALDKAENLTETSRFVLIDNYEISGGGIVVDTLTEEYRSGDTGVEWEKGPVTREERARRYGQRPTLILISGKKDVYKKDLAGYLERGLFLEGRSVFHLDAEEEGLITGPETRLEKLAQVAKVLLNAGNIVIAEIDDVTQSDLKITDAVIGSQDTKLIWVGYTDNADDHFDLHIEEDETRETMYLKVRKLLVDSKVIFDLINYY